MVRVIRWSFRHRDGMLSVWPRMAATIGVLLQWPEVPQILFWFLLTSALDSSTATPLLPVLLATPPTSGYCSQWS